MYLFCIILSFLFGVSGNISNEELKSYLDKKLTGYTSFNFETVSEPRVKFKEEMIIDTNREFKLTGNTAYVPVYIKTQNTAYSTQSYITLRLKLYKEVFILTNSVKRGEAIKSTDFQLKVVDVSGVRGKIVSEGFYPENYKAKFNLNINDVLTEELLEPIPVIKRGNKVTAYSVNGRVVISLEANAREDGSIGEIIRIVTPDKKLFKARVLDSLSVNIIQ